MALTSTDGGNDGQLIAIVQLGGGRDVFAVDGEGDAAEVGADGGNFCGEGFGGSGDGVAFGEFEGELRPLGEVFEDCEESNSHTHDKEEINSTETETADGSLPYVCLDRETGTSLRQGSDPKNHIYGGDADRGNGYEEHPPGI